MTEKTPQKLNILSVDTSKNLVNGYTCPTKLEKYMGLPSKMISFPSTFHTLFHHSRYSCLCFCCMDLISKYDYDYLYSKKYMSFVLCVVKELPV